MKTHYLLKQVFLVLTLSVLVTNMFSQQINVARSKWNICLKLAGSNCSEGGGACISEWKEHAGKDPCTTSDFWYFIGDPPVRTKAVCCSEKGMVNPNSPEQGIHPFQGANFYLAADTLFLMAQCIDGEDTFGVFIANLNTEVSTWSGVVSHIHQISTDTLVIDLFQADTLFPFYKEMSKVTYKFGPEIAENVCGGSAPSQTGIKIYRTPKVSTDFYPNPVTGNELSYSLVNPKAINSNISFKFYNTIGEMIFEYKPERSEGTIDISNLPTGLVFIVLSSDFATESKTIYIRR